MMNPVIHQLKNRRSIRKFTNEPVKDEDLTTILEAANQSPTSKGGQQTSIIVIRNKEKLKKLAEISGGQEKIAQADTYMVIIADYHRTAYAAECAGSGHIFQASADGILVATIEAGIVLSTIITAADSLGYGTTALGSFYKNPKAVIELLAMPQNTYPLASVIIGTPTDAPLPPLRPRVPLSSRAFTEAYDEEAMQQGVHQHDADLQAWWNEQRLADRPAYKQRMAMAYSKIQYPHIAHTMAEQGFEFKDK